MTRTQTRGAGWRVAEAALAEDVRTGLLSPGTRLPTEPALMARFAVGRHSIRRALAELETRGLVRTQQGSGTYVRPAGVLDYRLSRRTRFSQNLLDQGREPSGTVLAAAEVAAPPAVALALRLPDGETVFRFERLGLADGVPVNLSTNCHPARRFPGMIEAFRAEAGTSAVLAAFGVTDYLRLHSAVTARLPTEAEARHLDQPARDPVLVVTKVDADLAGVPVGWSETVWAAARVRLSIDNSAVLGHPGDAADVAR